MTPDIGLLHFLLEFVSVNKREQFERNLAMRTRHLTVVLEDLFQPHNASAVLRSCDCFGVQDVHIIENRNRYEVNPRVVHGAAKWLNLIKFNNQEENTTGCINHLKKQGYRVVATSPHAESVSLQNLDVSSPIALMFGTEQRGLSETALNLADEHMYIPMFGFTESLNISVSAAVCLQHLTDRLHHSDVPWQLSDEDLLRLHLDWAQSAVKDPDGLTERYFRDRDQ